MFFPEGGARVFLYGKSVSMRLSYDGLYALARHRVQQDPTTGNLFAFINRRATPRKSRCCTSIAPAGAYGPRDWNAVEAQIREEELTGQAKRVRRQEQARPIVERFFAWIDKQFETQGFLPSSSLLAALSYIRERRAGLSVYLDDPDVAIDTNHL